VGTDRGGPPTKNANRGGRRVSVPFCNQADITRNDARVKYETRRWDADGYERTERRAGACECPRCGLWWPLIEEPDHWELSDGDAIRWDAVGWWGAVHCGPCGLLMVTQPDGRVECLDLGGDDSK
jgi:hypothetical protein